MWNCRFGGGWENLKSSSWGADWGDDIGTGGGRYGGGARYLGGMPGELPELGLKFGGLVGLNGCKGELNGEKWGDEIWLIPGDWGEAKYSDSERGVPTLNLRLSTKYFSPPSVLILARVLTICLNLFLANSVIKAKNNKSVNNIR